MREVTARYNAINESERPLYANLRAYILCSYFQWSSVLRDWYDDQKVFYDLATGTCNTANPPNIAGTCSDYETVSLRIQLS